MRISSPLLDGQPSPSDHLTLTLDSDTIATDWEDWTLTAFARLTCIIQTNDGDPRRLCPGFLIAPSRRLDRMCDSDTQPLTGLHVVS